MLERLGAVLYRTGCVLAVLWALAALHAHQWDMDMELALLAFGPALGLYLIGRALLNILAGR